MNENYKYVYNDHFREHMFINNDVNILLRHDYPQVAWVNMGVDKKLEIIKIEEVEDYLIQLMS